MAHANTRKTIKLKVKGSDDELIAAGAITPGHLVKRSSATQCVVHATAGGPAERMFACEDALQGKTVDDAYASTNPVSLVRALPGDRINAIIKAGENIAAGDLLVSGGDGTLVERSATPTDALDQVVIAVAAEALDLSAGGATAGRCAVDVV